MMSWYNNLADRYPLDMEDHGDEMDIDLPSSFSGQNNDNVMNIFLMLGQCFFFGRGGGFVFAYQ